VAFNREAFYKEVGLLIQVARKRQGRTQEDVATDIGIPRATYANLESGRQRIPLDIVWKLGVVLGVPLDSLAPKPMPTTNLSVEEFPHSTLGTGTLGISLPTRQK